jgi:hypothetical protein
MPQKRVARPGAADGQSPVCGLLCAATSESAVKLGLQRAHGNKATSNCRTSILNSYFGPGLADGFLFDAVCAIELGGNGDRHGHRIVEV